MKSLISKFLACMFVAGVVASPIAVMKYRKIDSPKSYSYYSNIEKKEIPYSTTSSLDSATLKDPVKDVLRVVVLEKNSTVVIRGPVDRHSMATAMVEITRKASLLGKDKPIYLVLDTPGGSVFAGLEFIDYVKALPNPVHTITLFAASMGFQIVQNMDKRLITTSGVYMSHRARGGVRGQFDGELETRYKMIKENIDRLDYIAASRMKMTVKEYKALIKDEFWSNGFRSVNNNSADEEILVRCGKSLFGEKKRDVHTLFGQYTMRVSKCPLIRGNVTITSNIINKEDAEAVLKGFNNPESYVKEFITTGKHYKIFR